MIAGTIKRFPGDGHDTHLDFAGPACAVDGRSASRQFTLAGSRASGAVTKRTVHFANGATALTGTLYMPATGSHLPAIVALHGADTPGSISLSCRIPPT